MNCNCLYETTENNIYYTTLYGYLQKYSYTTDFSYDYVIIDFDVYKIIKNYDCQILYDKYIIFVFHEYINNIENSFMYLNARFYNMERIKWIKSLNIDFKNKTILEIGCGGCGDFTRFLYSEGASDIICCDARINVLEHLISRLKTTIPNIKEKCIELNVEDLNDIEYKLKDKKFDIILCVGLLYHINNPIEFLNKCKCLSNNLILETMLTQNSDSFIQCNEDKNNINQSFSGIGNRINKEYLYNYLTQIYNDVDISKQPDSIEISSGQRFTYFCKN